MTGTMPIPRLAGSPLERGNDGRHPNTIVSIQLGRVARERPVLGMRWTPRQPSDLGAARAFTQVMEPIVHAEMPAWLASQVGRLQTIAQFYTSEGRDLSSSGAMSRAQAAYQEAFTLGMDIVAIQREWTVPTE